MKQATLFKTIANEVATGFAEQYLTVFRDGGMAVMFSTPSVEDAIQKARTRFKSGTEMLTFECLCGDFGSSAPLFTDDFKGVIESNGLLIEVSVRELRDGVHRVLFSRVDAAKMYQNHDKRIEQVEAQVQVLLARTKSGQ